MQSARVTLGAHETAPTIDGLMARKKQAPSGFGERLVALRRERGLTQVELAEAIDSSQRVISYYENHAEHPAADMVIALAGALGVTTDQLLGIKPTKKTAKATAQDTETRRLWKRFQLVEELPEKDQRAVLRLIQSLAASRVDQRAASR